MNRAFASRASASRSLVFARSVTSIEGVGSSIGILRTWEPPGAGKDSVDPKWGESPCAFVELKAGAAATEEELIAHCRAQMARYKVPKKVVFGPLPKTSTGKLQKFVLRARAKSTSAIE